MKLGAETSRWQDALSFVEKGIERARDDAASDCQSYRFGHRLGPLTPTTAMPNSSGTAVANRLTPVNTKGSQYAVASVPSPEASDTRLADALRELSSRIDARDTAGLVLLSDGRVRGSESVEQLASLLGKRNIPIHVVPVGNSTGTGDVARTCQRTLEPRRT